jgi:hypothetical protein
MMGRKLLSLTFSLIFLLFLISPSSSTTSFRKLLGTEKYAIVGISNCSSTTEINADDGYCIQHMAAKPDRFNNSCIPFYSVLYAPVEPESPHPPKILQVFLNDGKLAYRLVNIEFPYSDKTVAHSRIPTEKLAYFTTNQTIHPLISDIIGVVYDHVSGFLYIIYKAFEDGQMKPKADVYQMEQDFSSPNSLLNTLLYQFYIDPNFVDTVWSSDIYSKMFYYQKNEYSHDHGHITSNVYSIPYGSLTYYLKRGIRGKLEHVTESPRREKVQVTNGLVYSILNEGNNITSFLRPLHRDVSGTSCVMNCTRTQDYFFVLTGWEFCKLRDGHDANLTGCNMEFQKAAPESAAAEQQSFSNSGFLWAITLGIIINAVILLTILCVLCKRKDVDKYDNGMYPTNKDPHGALLTPEEIFRRRRTTSTLTEF